MKTEIPSREWFESRLCRCGECRFAPLRKCKGEGKVEQLWTSLERTKGKEAT